MIRNRMTGGMGVLLAAVLLAGCATVHPKAAPEAASVPARSASTPVVVQLPAKPAEGSLWSDTASNLVGDLRARQVGDTVTVDIVENTTSQLNANTTSSRQSSVDAGVDNLFGYMRALEATNPNLNRDNKGSLGSKLISANMTNAFTGKGSSDRSSQVTASIGARVVQVLPNGNLVIIGKRETRVNQETQYIAVSGIVRPSDIDSDNRVQSTYLADAKIQYFGRGALADKQRPGWVSRVLDAIWPF
jgi:flagellar L-ring protein FlgH